MQALPESYSRNKNYLPNLDGLRFIGSLVIIIFHIEDIKNQQGRATIPTIRIYNVLGNYDVSLFFVLSGFLITYLLLKEKKESGSIDLKAYYVRRTLRIWPLYYLIIFLGFFVLPHFDPYFDTAKADLFYNNFWYSLIGCLLFLTPFVSRTGGLPETIGPIWTVGVEELFYVCWPLFLRKTKRYLLLMIGIVVFVLLLRNGLSFYNQYFDPDDTMWIAYKFMKRVLIQYRISCMAIGGIGAYLVVLEKDKMLKFLYRKDIQWIVYIITILLLKFRVGMKPFDAEDFPNVSYEMYSVLFAIIIINLACNPHSIVKLKYKWMIYLGKISYGLYLFHPIMRVFSLQLTEYLFSRQIAGLAMNICMYSLTIGSTILVSVVSFEFFEKRMMNLKNKFTAKKQKLKSIPT